LSAASTVPAEEEHVGVLARAAVLPQVAAPLLLVPDSIPGEGSDRPREVLGAQMIRAVVWRVVTALVAAELGPRQPLGLELGASQRMTLAPTVFARRLVIAFSVRAHLGRLVALAVLASWLEHLVDAALIGTRSRLPVPLARCMVLLGKVSTPLVTAVLHFIVVAAVRSVTVNLQFAVPLSASAGLGCIQMLYSS